LAIVQDIAITIRLHLHDRKIDPTEGSRPGLTSHQGIEVEQVIALGLFSTM
jgi:hypothetical protein